MDIKSVQSKMSVFLNKYKYVGLVLLAGMVLMLWPKSEDSIDEDTSVQQVVEEVSLNEELSEILSKIEGAGNVQVLLTVAAGERILYQTDEDISLNSDNSTSQSKTVIISSYDKAQNGLVKQVLPPTYLGAIVVCQGADSPAVQLAIVDAVSKVTGLGANKISVLKMK